MDPVLKAIAEREAAAEQRRQLESALAATKEIASLEKRIASLEKWVKAQEAQKESSDG